MRCIRCRCRFDPVDGLSEMIMTRIAPCVIAALALGLAACTNPYDPVQRGLGGAYWERLLALPLGERRVAGREPPSELRSEGQPGYSGGSLLHLHLHRAPITLPSLRISRLRISGLPTVGLWVPRLLGLWVSGLWIPWRLCISRLLTGSAMDREWAEAPG